MTTLMLHRIISRFSQININSQNSSVLDLFSCPLQIKRYKGIIDTSRIPKLIDDELEEQFVRGSGPGGQAVNKTSNCCVLKHKPTGIVVKCHIHRSMSENRKEARKILITKLDNHVNGEFSVESQKKSLNAKKSNENTRRRKKLEELKRQWRERESLDPEK